MKDTFNQTIGFADNMIEKIGLVLGIAAAARARGDHATAARFDGKADAMTDRVETAINNEIAKLR